MSRFLLFCLKIALFGVTIWYVVYKLLNIPEDQSFFTGWTLPGMYLTGLILLCMAGTALNWSIETIKWQFLYSKVQTISLKKAWKGVLCGTAISIWMPNRMGDYLGRILYIPGNHYGKAILCSLLGNFSQFLVTILFGTAGAAYYFFRVNGMTSGQEWIIAAGTIVITLFLVSYLILPALLPYLPHRAGKWNLSRYIRILYRFTLTERLHVLTLSAARYLVFTLQYWLLLHAFGVHIPVILCLSLISLVFLVQSIIPSFAFSEVGIRGAASLFFLGSVTLNDPGIVMATYTLWAVNLIAPAAIGAYFILHSGLHKSSVPHRAFSFFRLNTHRNRQ